MEKKLYSYKPVQFFLIAYSITWVAWFTAAYFSYQQSDQAQLIQAILQPLGLLGPPCAALWLIFTSNSRELKGNFIDRLSNLRLIKLSTIPALLLIMPAAWIISAWISYLFFGQSLTQLTITNLISFSAGLMPVPVMLYGAAFLEEVGWRGYGVDSLRGKRTFFTVTLIFAALWALWHTPLFFINGYYHNLILRENPLFALNFYLGVFPVAFINNWLWYKNSGSILSGFIFHAVANTVAFLQLTQIAESLQTVVLTIFVIGFVILNKRLFFSEFPTEIGYYGKETQPSEKEEQMRQREENEYTRSQARPWEHDIKLPLGRTKLAGILAVPPNAKGVVVFAHGSGSSRLSPHNNFVARRLEDAGFATLLFDLLTEKEAEDRRNVFDIDILANRLIYVSKWLKAESQTKDLPIGYFGASTGTGAALQAAARETSLVTAIVSRGGRPDLASDYLQEVMAPTLLIVGGDDMHMTTLNEQAYDDLRCEKELAIIDGVMHLFEDPEALDMVADLASDWFERYLTQATSS